MYSSQVFIALSSIVLGFRHGIDWDHVAALLDITSSTTLSTDLANDFGSCRKRALLLSGVYGLGHCSIVILLGILISYFKAFVPNWSGSISEKLVGLTLFLFGFYVIFLMVRAMQRGSSWMFGSRGALLLDGIQRGFRLVFASNTPILAGANGKLFYGKRTAFGLGVIHGAGVETASQILLLAAVSTSSKLFGICLLLNFSMGFLIAMLCLAYLGIQGVSTFVKIKPLYMVSSVLTAAFSIAIGYLFMSGQSALLPVLSP